jgi:hypothetical protein
VGSVREFVKHVTDSVHRLTVPWLYPAEIFPLEVRAKGNAFGVVGWSEFWTTTVIGR